MRFIRKSKNAQHLLRVPVRLFTGQQGRFRPGNSPVPRGHSMQHVLFHYHLDPITWVYLSSLLVVAVYFKFGRLFSLRNWDLILLLLLAWGVSMIARDQRPPAIDSPAVVAQQQEPSGEPAGPAPAQGDWAIWGYRWLLGVGVLLLLRMLADPFLVRRPLLEPNLSAGGLAFLGLALFVFLSANILTARVPTAEPLAQRANAPTAETPPESAPEVSPAVEEPLPIEGSPAAEETTPLPPRHPLLNLLPWIPTKAFSQTRPVPSPTLVTLTKTVVVLSHMALVIGLVLIGLYHFGNIWTGVAVATLYLVLPYTAQLFGRVDHVLPAVLLVWAVLQYRHPMLAGALLGLAIGTIFFPVFLLPLWISFYWQRGRWRFLIGVGLSLGGLVLALIPVSANAGEFWQHVLTMLGGSSFGLQGVDGLWNAHEPLLRIPLIALTAVLSVALAFWPAQKNLGTLISCSGAIMLAVQFWYAHQGLLYVNWYLPLFLLTSFRPNLEHRVAVASLGEGHLFRRRSSTSQVAA